MELGIPIDSELKQPLYEQIYVYIRDEIKKKKLIRGEKLPSTRALALSLHVSRQTVTIAYEQLVAEGYVEAIKNSGYFIKAYENIYVSNNESISCGSSNEDEEKYDYDLSPNGIDFNLFPFSVWRKLSRETLVKENVKIFSQGDDKGELGLRREISKYLYASRGISAKEEQIIIAAGTQYLLILINLLLKKEKIAIENPNYKQWTQLFDKLGLKLEAMDIDENGIKVEDLEKADVDLAMLTPNHHYPTGIVMPVSRRLKLIDWVNSKEERYLIEDDYDSEFRYRGKPIPALASIDKLQRVVYLGTFSRAISSSVRISFMVLPKTLLKKYNENLSFMACTVPRIDQDILYRFIKEGYFERHLNRMRFSYKAKHDIITQIFKQQSEKFDILGDNSGAHLLIKAKYGISEEQMVSRAKEKGVKVYPVSEFYIDSEKCGLKSTVLIGFASIAKVNLEKACKAILCAWLEFDD